MNTQSLKITAKHAALGAVAGFLAGALVGCLLVFSGVLEKAVAEFGGSSPALGLTIHMFGSTMMGALFGLFFGKRVTSLRAAIALAIGFALLAWVAAGLLVPAIHGARGADIWHHFVGTIPQVPLGHSIFGLLLGLLFWWVLQKYGTLAAWMHQTLTSLKKSAGS